MFPLESSTVSGNYELPICSMSLLAILYFFCMMYWHCITPCQLLIVVVGFCWCLRADIDIWDFITPFVTCPFLYIFLTSCGLLISSSAVTADSTWGQIQELLSVMKRQNLHRQLCCEYTLPQVFKWMFFPLLQTLCPVHLGIVQPVGVFHVVQIGFQAICDFVSEFSGYPSCVRC